MDIPTLEVDAGLADIYNKLKNNGCNFCGYFICLSTVSGQSYLVILTPIKNGTVTIFKIIRAKKLHYIEDKSYGYDGIVIPLETKANGIIETLRFLQSRYGFNNFGGVHLKKIKKLIHSSSCTLV